MMTSDSEYKEAYAWIWLPGETKPIVAGLLSLEGKSIVFNYGKSYLERINDEPRAIPIYEPELPLKAGKLPLLPSLSMPGCRSTRFSSDSTGGERYF
ncbi:hypothetical protein [Yersinia alsatica]|uniref:hypothetical protein n=1 Tax=Yersinia alsatica TaxID=2890317 RepID=UPI001643AF8D|nr:hypothetical protein [Yersinia alsatica]